MLQHSPPPADLCSGWSKPRKAGLAAGAPMDSGVKAAFIQLHGPSHPPMEMNVYFQIRLSHFCSSCMGPTARQPGLVLCQLQLTTAVDPPDQKHPIPRHHLRLIQHHLSPLATLWPCLSLASATNPDTLFLVCLHISSIASVILFYLFFLHFCINLIACKLDLTPADLAQDSSTIIQCAQSEVAIRFSNKYKSTFQKNHFPSKFSSRPTELLVQHHPQKGGNS